MQWGGRWQASASRAALSITEAPKPPQVRPLSGLIADLRQTATGNTAVPDSSNTPTAGTPRENELFYVGQTPTAELTS
jgi:hypothetical protein